jgi:hypothetical protein
MADEEKKEEGKSCCPCGKSNCCCKKAIGALALLVVGLAAGFFAGRHCGKGMCPLAPAATAAPAATPAK